MTEILLYIAVALGALCLILLLVLLAKTRRTGDAAVMQKLDKLEDKTDAVGKLADYNARSLERTERTTEAHLAEIRNRLTEDLKYVVDVNAKNLERIRMTVDEKLTRSIDGKLSDSFARITERLEKMYESVGEMKGLSSSVADIRRVFTNVKLRGTWGEAQLDALLAQMLAPEQYLRSVRLNPLDNTLVDFVIVLPAKDGAVYLPVDSKFPVEEFERLAAASERADKEGEERARKNLERAVKVQADSIAKKYLMPPVTTDFGVMYLPSEALYAEVVRTPGLADWLRARRILAAGPTNFGALLSTLQTGFRTAAIERRSGELREMLDSFRADFVKFAELLEKTRKKLQEAQDTVESAEKRTGTIGRKLDSFRGLGSALPPGGEDD